MLVGTDSELRFDFFDYILYKIYFFSVSMKKKKVFTLEHVGHDFTFWTYRGHRPACHLLGRGLCGVSLKDGVRA